jgi:hypothetical protein
MQPEGGAAHCLSYMYVTVRSTPLYAPVGWCSDTEVTSLIMCYIK